MPKPCLVLNNGFAIVRSSWGIHSTFLDQSTGKLCHIEALAFKGHLESWMGFRHCGCGAH